MLLRPPAAKFIKNSSNVNISSYFHLQIYLNLFCNIAAGLILELANDGIYGLKYYRNGYLMAQHKTQSGTTVFVFMEINQGVLSSKEICFTKRSIAKCTTSPIVDVSDNNKLFMLVLALVFKFEGMSLQEHVNVYK